MGQKPRVFIWKPFTGKSAIQLLYKNGVPKSASSGQSAYAALGIPTFDGSSGFGAYQSEAHAAFHGVSTGNEDRYDPPEHDEEGTFSTSSAAPKDNGQEINEILGVSEQGEYQLVLGEEDFVAFTIEDGRI